MKLKFEQSLRTTEKIDHLQKRPWTVHFNGKQAGTLGLDALLDFIRALPEDTSISILAEDRPLLYRDEKGKETLLWDDMVIRLKDLIAALPPESVGPAFWKAIAQNACSAYRMAVQDEVAVQLEDEDPDLVDYAADYVAGVDESVFNEECIHYLIEEAMREYRVVQGGE